MPADTHWHPSQYLKFSNHRLRPALELMDRIQLVAPEVIYDLGCDTGQVTQLMAEQWPAASVCGVDSSAEMLAQARTTSDQVRWIQADIADWTPNEPPDLIYSNATLHWLEDHPVLFPRLLGCLNPGGFLAVQMPLSWGAPSHQLMRETLADGGQNGGSLGTEQLRASVARKWVEGAGVYYDLLAGKTALLDIWETEYLQVLTGEDPVLEWVKGTGLRPVLNGLSDDDRATFLVTYRRRLCEAYPVRPDGRTLYPFRRLFIIAGV